MQSGWSTLSQEWFSMITKEIELHIQKQNEGLDYSEDRNNQIESADIGKNPIQRDGILQIDQLGNDGSITCASQNHSFGLIT